MNLNILFFLISFSHVTESADAADPVGTVEKDLENELTEGITDTKLTLRKCCAPYEYYNTEAHECIQISNGKLFKTKVNEFLLNSKNQSFLTYSQKIDACPQTRQKPDISFISNPYSHSLLQNGKIHDHNSGLLFDSSKYCLEMVGSTIDSSSLVFAYCMKPQNLVHKCCPEGHYFDLRSFDCSAFYSSNEHEGNSRLLPYITKGSKLIYESDLICNDYPARINLDEARFHGNMLCITKMEQCYGVNDFCIDNMLIEDRNEITLSAFVCPDNFINKCCPDGSSLYKDGCFEASRQSLLLVHILQNLRYQVKSFSQMGLECNPVTIEESKRSDIDWIIDSYGFAKIKTKNDTIITRNYCIDDFVNKNEVFPVIKVCSEDVGIYHEVASIKDWSRNTLGKCCPSNMIYRPRRMEGNSPQCIKKPEDVVDLLEEDFLHRYNISNLVYTQFPNCSTVEYYHKYDLGPRYHDYAELTLDRDLKIIRKENNCKIKETQLDTSKFCLDFVVTDDGYKPVAIVCIFGKNSHTERNAIVVSLVGISCAALISAFFSLLFMRVRRGMVTMKKIKTLAGRILTSYVLSQLVGYLILGIGVLADFQENAGSCFILAGFLMFFLIAAFCWNTSICMEGLLLTMHIQMSESRRYILHSIWAWGMPGIFTVSALIKDSKRDTLPCDAITPKFGVERCFFSDPVAQLLYFYFPISITVVINGFLLISAKIIRKRKLKNLEKDPNRQRNHENLQQVLSIKSIKSKLRGEPSIKPISNRSGLRTHHNRNIWLESLKLVLWSGTTWLMEIIGTLVTMYLGRSRGEWYNYLWYFPMGFNCLRGLGIFVIISFNSENKTRVMRIVRPFSTRFTSSWNKVFPTMRQNSPSNQGWRAKAIKGQKMKGVQFMPQGGKSNADLETEKKTRSTSVTTILTNVSNSTIGSPSVEPGETLQRDHTPPLLYHSISQSDVHPTLPDVLECIEGGDFDATIHDENADINASLDNTSMEDVFWEEHFKEKRDVSRTEKSVEDEGKKLCKNKGSDKTDHQLRSLNGETQKEKNMNDKVSGVQKIEYKNFYYCTHL